MYGTVARVIVKQGMEQQLINLMSTSEAESVPGFIQTIVYSLEGRPNECLVAVVFDSKESYVANAASPEQNVRFHEMRALLETDPVWDDGEIIHRTT